MFRFIGAARSLFFGKKRVVVIPPPPVGSSHILTEGSNIITTEAGDQLITET